MVVLRYALLISLVLASNLFEAATSESFAPLRPISKQRIVIPVSKQPCYHVPRGGATSTVNANIRTKIEPIGQAFVDLTSSIWSLSKFIFSHQIEDTEKKVAEPIQQRINQALLHSSPAKGKEATVTKQPSTTTSDNKPVDSVAIALFPSRVFKLSMAAWILSEALDYLGILNDDTPHLLKSQMDRVWYDVQPRIAYAAATVQNWWSGTITFENLGRIPSKYNFAVGTSLGMIAAPVLSVVAGSLWRPAVLLYIVAEANASLKAKGKLHLGSLLARGHRGIGTIVDRCLERLRQRIRSALPQPQSADGALIQTSGGSRDLHSRKMKNFQPATTRKSMLPWVRSKPSDRVVAYKETTKLEHPMVVMMRHGFMVGSAIGLFIRV